MGGVTRKKRIVGNGRTRAAKSCELLASSASLDIIVDSTWWIPKRVPNALAAYHCEITVLELPSVHRKSVLV